MTRAEACRWALMAGLVGLWGCASRAPAPAPPPRLYEGLRLTVAALSDPAILETVNAQRGEWEERQKAEVALRKEPAEPKSLEGIDVLLFRGERLGDLVDLRALAVVPDAVLRPPAPREDDDSSRKTARAEDTFAFADVLPAFRDQVSRYGDDRMGLPYGGSALVLVYRRDALESKSNAPAAKEAGVALEPPRTWEQLDALAKFLHGRDSDNDGHPEAGIALAWGADPEGVGNATLLARAAALGYHPDQFSFLFDGATMEPRIASPPFVEALQKIVGLKAHASAGHMPRDAEQARAAFRAGHVALLIDRAERAATWTDPKRPHPVGVAALPGSRRVYDPDQKSWSDVTLINRPGYLPFGGGWLVGVPAACTGRQRDAALDFLKYLTGPETSGRILSDRAFPMLPTRASQLGAGLPDPRSAPGVETRAWGRAVADTLTAGRVVPGVRIPEADGYLADLDKARVAALEGAPADQALRMAAGAWTARTKRLGIKRQLWHYRRSTNRSTEPEPPAR